MTDQSRIEKRITTLEERVSRLESKAPSLQQPPLEKKSKSVSIKEFILTYKPDRDVQKTLAIGYYLEKYEGFSAFSVKDLERNFKLAKESIPGNINDKVNGCIRRGHMTEVVDTSTKGKTWMLTNSGERFVENGFSDE